MKRIILATLCAMMLIGCNQQPKTMENQAINNILTRVSVRQFTGEPITEAQVDTLLRAAMAAPSAVNRQPWTFVVVTDPAIIAELGAKLPYSRCENGAACAIVPCGDMTKTLDGAAADYWIQDVSAATENLLLAAHAMGLGAVWTGVYPIAERVLMTQTILELPEHIIPLCVVPVGVPAEQPAVKDKYKTENIHYNRW